MSSDLDSWLKSLKELAEAAQQQRPPASRPVSVRDETDEAEESDDAEPDAEEAVAPAPRTAQETNYDRRKREVAEHRRQREVARDAARQARRALVDTEFHRSRGQESADADAEDDGTSSGTRSGDPHAPAEIRPADLAGRIARQFEMEQQEKRLRAAQNQAAQLRATAQQAPKPATPAATGFSALGLSQKLAGNPDYLREAFLVREILGPPKGLQ